MGSHHFIGTGAISARLRKEAGDPDALLEQIAAQVRESGLGVVAQQAVRFEGGGLTLVWVLSESHLVVHYWAEEGFATIDLHVCDYKKANHERARRLADSLAALCFTPGSERWQTLHVEPPVTLERYA
jgi:S-adenosylmethionine/arginine decarboxylase-like enzyme